MRYAESAHLAFTASAGLAALLGGDEGGDARGNRRRGSLAVELLPNRFVLLPPLYVVPFRHGNAETKRKKPQNLERDTKKSRERKRAERERQRERAESSAAAEVGGFMPHVWYGRLLFEMIVEGF